MARRVVLCYITDRRQFPGSESARRQRLLAKIEAAARAGVDYVQLREKDLPARELEWLAAEAVKLVRTAAVTTENEEPKTRLLINSRSDIALAVGIDGIHLPSDDVSPVEVRHVWDLSADSVAGTRPIIEVSCHSVAEVERARDQGADYVLLAPIFEKKDAPGTKALGLETLKQGCRCGIPVLALGGVTLANAEVCIAAGAAGIAAIRLFQENDVAEIVGQLRGHR